MRSQVQTHRNALARVVTIDGPAGAFLLSGLTFSASRAAGAAPDSISVSEVTA